MGEDDLGKKRMRCLGRHGGKQVEAQFVHIQIDNIPVLGTRAQMRCFGLLMPFRSLKVNTSFKKLRDSRRFCSLERDTSSANTNTSIH